MSCVHGNSAPRLRGNAIYRQCLECGSAVGSAIARASFKPEEIEAMQPFDLEFQENGWKKGFDERNGEAEQERLQRRQEWFEQYREYLKSDKWRVKRLAALKRDGYVCQACLSRKASQVHHKTYEHVFDEPLFDLESVCEHCHQKLHAEKNDSTFA